jgi:hypothetical protein
MIQKVHVKQGFDVDCTRREKFGNPFEMKDKTNEERNRVCDLHMDWLIKATKGEEIVIGKFSNKWVIKHLYLLDNKRCGCWCGKLRCHVDNLIEMRRKQEK